MARLDGASSWGTLHAMAKPTLIYFASRGRAEIIRLVLADAGVEYEEHLVGKGTPPKKGRPTDFEELKATGLLPFEALPVWEEPDGFRLAQSHAILGHLARGHGLYGATARETALCDQMLGVVDDVRGELRKVAAAEASKRPAVREELAARGLPRWMGYIDRVLAGNGGGEGFSVGAGPTVADLALYFLLEVMRDNEFGAAIDRHPRLVGLTSRIAARPRIAAYLASPARHPPLLLPR